MHPRSIVSVKRFRHKRRRLAILVCSIANYVLEDLKVVGGAQQRCKPEVDLTLPGGGHFVMVTLNRYAALAEFKRNFRTQIAERISGWNRDVTFFRSDAVTKIRPLELVGVATCIPMAFVGVDRITGRLLFVVKFDRIKNKEFGFRAKVGNVGKAGKLQVILGTYSHRARIEGITLLGDRIDGVAYQAKGWVIGERIHPHARCVWNEQHV